MVPTRVCRPLKTEPQPLIALVIDDHESTAETTAFFLQTHGYEALAVFSGTESLDNRAKAETARHLLRHYHAGHGRLPGGRRACANPDYWPYLVALSGTRGEAYEQRARVAGFNDIIYKPVDAYHMLTLVQQIVPRPSAGGPV